MGIASCTGVTCYALYGLERIPYEDVLVFLCIRVIAIHRVHERTTLLALFFFCVVEHNHYFLQERFQPVFKVVRPFYITYSIRYTERHIH